MTNQEHLDLANQARVFIETLRGRYHFTHDAAYTLWHSYRLSGEPIPTAEQAGEQWQDWDARDFVKHHELSLKGNITEWMRTRVQQFAIFADHDGNTRYLLHFKDAYSKYPAPPIMFARPL
jgi:hypothetical protein